MKTIFDQITDKLRADIKSQEKTIEDQYAYINKLTDKIDRLIEENNRLRQELEHKAFQDDF